MTIFLHDEAYAWTPPEVAAFLNLTIHEFSEMFETNIVRGEE